MFLCRRRQCVEAGLHLTHISFARMFLLKMARNPWCSESSTRWVCSTSGKSSVRKGIRDSLKQTRKVALQIREKRSTKSLVSVDLSKHGIKNFPAFLGYWRFIIHLFSSWHLSQPQPICFGSFFFLWTSGFCVRTTTICKVPVRWTSKVKNKVLCPANFRFNLLDDHMG